MHAVRAKQEFVSPIRVVRSIEGRGLRLGVHVENVLASPGSGVGVVLDGLQIPFRSPGHGVHRDAAQEANLAVGTGANLDGFYERFQVRRVSFASDFHANEIAVRVVLIMVDRVADFSQRFVKLCFPLSLNAKAHDGQCGGSKYKKDGRCDNQLQKRKAAFGMSTPLICRQQPRRSPSTSKS